jgi:hypothetical protein
VGREGCKKGKVKERLRRKDAKGRKWREECGGKDVKGRM